MNKPILAREEDREFVDKVACGRRAAPPFKYPCWKEALVDAFLLDKEADFVGFFFQILLIDVGQDKVQNKQFGECLDCAVISTRFTVAGVFLAEGGVDGPGEEMINVQIAPLIKVIFDMLVSSSFGHEIGHAATPGNSDEVGKLPLQEEAGVRGNEIKELAFTVGVSVPSQCFELLCADVHNERMSREYSAALPRWALP